MTTDVNTTRQLLGVIRGLEIPSTFLLSRYFGSVQTFDTDVIDFDQIGDDNLLLAPFVAPSAKGKIIKERGYTTKTFRAPYIKPKTPVDVGRALKRAAGEGYGGTTSPAQRYDAAKAQILMDHMNMITRRKEWMAAQALISGQITVEGEDYPEQTVDFGRDAGLSIALAGGARWGEVGVNPLDDIETWAGLVQTASGGPATDVIFDPEAWKIVRSNESFMKLLDLRRQASGNAELGPIARGQGNEKARYVGSIGSFDFWVYQEIYKTDGGVIAKLIPDNSVTMVGMHLEGVQAHGAIMDPTARFVAMEVYPTNWVDDDPPIEFLMTQSAPLVVPARVDNCLHATVR